MNMKKDDRIFADLKTCVTEMGLHIKSENISGDFLTFDSELAYDTYRMDFRSMLDLPNKTVALTIHYGTVTDEKKVVLYDLVNRINRVLCSNHFAVHPDTGQVALLGGMYLPDENVNKAEFRMIVKQMLSGSYTFFPLIGQQTISDETPAEMWNQFLLKNKDRIV